MSNLVIRNWNSHYLGPRGLARGASILEIRSIKHLFDIIF